MLQKIVSLLTVVVLLATSLNEAQGHFLYVYGEGGDVKVVFGEALEPDRAKFLGGLAAMKSHSVIDGTAKEVTFQKKMDDELGWYETSLEIEAIWPCFWTTAVSTFGTRATRYLVNRLMIYRLT